MLDNPLFSIPELISISIKIVVRRNTMGKKVISLALALVMVLALVHSQSFAYAAVNSDFFDAAQNVDGFIAPIDDPDASAIKIKTAKDLSDIANDMYGTYVLMNDIDLSGYGNWTPIGRTLAGAFHGKFDGQGHTISGLSSSITFDSANLTAVSYAVGLFGICDGAHIKNLRLEDVNISIKTTSGYRYENSVIDSENTVYAGSIAGYIKNNAVIFNCSSFGVVNSYASGEGYSPTVAGGLVGFADLAIVSYSYNGADISAYNGNGVQAENAYAGGLVGRANTECVIDCSYNLGSVTSTTLDYGNSYAGGIVAESRSSVTTINDSFNEGTIQALAGNMFCDSAYGGGISGDFKGSIDRAYNSGSVTAQAKDPYGISDSKAYAGGICGISTNDSSISNSAIVNSTVSASASGTKTQYRISNGGTKSNNTTISSMISGSTNDANNSCSQSDTTSVDLYSNVLGWDFTSTWEMVSGKNYPQLRQIDTSSDHYKQQYVEQHIDFLNNGSYQNIVDNYRWAQIYWSAENNFKSNLGAALYKGADKLVDLLTLDISGLLFEDGNPFKLMLADYVSDQTVEASVVHLYEITVPYELDKKYKKVKEFIKNNWKDEWGQLSDEDLFWLFKYKEKSSDEWINSDFENHISEIVYETRHSGEDLENIIGATSSFIDKLLEEKENANNTIEWFNGLIDYAGHVAAYVQANEEFKTILEQMCENLPDGNALEVKYKTQLSIALKSYTQYNDSEHLAERIFLNYFINDKIDGFAETVKKAINTTVENWIKDTFSEAVLGEINKIGWVADKTWKICEYITKNGELQECREMLKANAYFEQTMFNTMQSIKGKLELSPTFENACLFDVAFKFFKETEICSMDTIISYFDTYQTSWAQAIRHMSNTFMNSAIEEVQINKLFIYNTYCHGTSYTLGGKVITIACPTNVFIYDSNEALVCSIEDNVVTYCDPHILAYTTDTVKLVTVPTDQNYSVRIDATDDGIMSYSVSEYDSSMKNVQATVYNDVSIIKGVSFAGFVNDEIETKSESYNLTGSDNTYIEDYVVADEESSTPVKKIAITNPEEIIPIGEQRTLIAEVSPDNSTIKSIAWSSSDTDVVTVSDNGLIQAIGEGNAMICAQAVYGGVSDKLEVTVVSDEHTVYIRKHPISAVYVQNEQAEVLEIEWYELNADDNVNVQWYAAETETSEGNAIVGATGKKFTPPTDEVGKRYYYATISDSAETRETKRACIDVAAEKIVASGTLGENAIWELTESQKLIISGIGELVDSSDTELLWDEYKQSIQSIEINEGITSIRISVFKNMNGLKSVSFPKTVEFISEGILQGCTSLTNLTIPFVGSSRHAKNTKDAVLGHIFGTVPSGINQYFILDGSSLRGYNYAIPQSLKNVKVTDAIQLPFGAFCNCLYLEKVELNKGVESIGGYSFYNCIGLTELTIPWSVTSIEENALKGCNSLVELTVPFVGANRNVNNTYDTAFGFIFGRTSDESANYYVQYPILNGNSLSGYGYAIPDTLRTVRITDAERIPFGSFSGLTQIEGVIFNANISEIERYAFDGCTALNDLYYCGSEQQWNNKTIGGNNSPLTNASQHFFHEDDEYNCVVTITYDEGCIVRIFVDDGESSGRELRNGDTITHGSTVVIDAMAIFGYELCDDPTGTVTITDDTIVTVSSQPKTYTVTASATTGGTAFTQNPAKPVPYGTTVTLTAGEAESGYRFIGWYQPNGKLLTGEMVYVVTVTSNAAYEARYQQTSGVVTFMSNGNVISTSSENVTEYPTDPTPMYGYVFDKWDMTIDEINAACAVGNVTVTALFKPEAKSITVMVYNGESVEPEIMKYTESTVVKVKAVDVEGKIFSHWTLDGEILGYNRYASFRVNESHILTAVYATEAVEAIGTATLKTSTYNVSTKKLTSVAYLTVPEGAKIVAAGLYAASGSGHYDPNENLTANNADYVKSLASAVGKGGSVSYTWNKTNVNPGDVWYLRAYISYTLDGITKTVYGYRITVKAGRDYDSAEKGTAAIKSVSYNSSTKKATFVAYLTVPEKATIEIAGLVAASSVSFDPASDVLTADNADYVKNLASVAGKGGAVTYTWNKSAVNPGDTWYARAYLIYTDSSGIQHTLYGELMMLTAD